MSKPTDDKYKKFVTERLSLEKINQYREIISALAREVLMNEMEKCGIKDDVNSFNKGEG